MDGISVLLLLGAAVCHALWNLRLKCCSDKNAVAWWSLVVMAPLVVPALWSGGVPLKVWPLLGASVVCEAGYYYCLTRAYADGDFSLVYPVARGTAPAFVLLWATLFLRERVHPAGLAGIFLIVFGVAVSGGLWALLQNRSRAEAIKIGGLRLAFTVALFISGYTTLDGAAVKSCQPLAYTACVFAFTAVAVTPLLARRPWSELRVSLSSNRFDVFAIAVLSLLAYGLVLAAYARGTVAYAAAGREVSIIFGAVAGWKWLGESLGAARILGALLIFCGIAMIAVWG